MGHHKDIHKNVYRVPVPVTEITCVSKLLMSAIGENDDREDENNSDVELCAPNDQIDSNANNYSTRPISNKRRDIAKVNIESEIDQISVKSTSRRSLNKPKVDIEAEKNQNLTQSN
ncbi:hypothetical protein CVS40_12956 [Lucilia cuprina]|nr:hypothetical protein CVS40_12956 [Lucilia cuprina]